MATLRSPISQITAYTIRNIGEFIRWLDSIRRHTYDIRKLDVVVDPTSVAANITAEQTVAVTGLKTDDVILSVIKPTLTAGVAVVQGRVSAADTLALQFVNATGGAIDPPSETYTVIYIKNSRN